MVLPVSRIGLSERVTLNFGFFRRSEVVGARPTHRAASAGTLRNGTLAVAFRQHSRGAQAGEIVRVQAMHRNNWKFDGRVGMHRQLWLH